jgi:hypothetical protein
LAERPKGLNGFREDGFPDREITSDQDAMTPIWLTTITVAGGGALTQLNPGLVCVYNAPKG